MVVDVARLFSIKWNVFPFNREKKKKKKRGFQDDLYFLKMTGRTWWGLVRDISYDNEEGKFANFICKLFVP